MSNRLFKIIVLLLVLFAATAVWIPRQRALAASRARLAEKKALQQNLQQHIDAANAELSSLRADLKTENTRRRQTQSAIAHAQAELNKIDPQSRWTAPPENLPDWNSDSPYVWLRKEILPQLPVKAFTENGALNQDVASVLTLDPKQTAALNTTLTDIMAEYHALETSKVQKSDEHLPGIAEQDGEKLTLVVPPQPDDGKMYKQQFETALRDALGAQRADLLLQTAETWLDEQFSQSGAKPKTISILRHPDGSYSLSVKSGNGWFSTGGPWPIIQRNIPAHLRPLFNEIVQPQPAQNAP